MSGGNWDAPTAEFWVYDAGTDSWEAKPPMLDALNIGCAGVIGSQIFFVGGERPGLYGTTLNQMFQLAC